MKKILLTLMLLTAAAQAQSPPAPGPVAVLGGVASLNAFSTSSRATVAAAVSAYPAVMFINDGTHEAFVAIGTSSVTATTGSLPLPPGNCVTLWLGSSTYFAAVTAASTTTIRAVQWNGAPGFSCVSSSTGGISQTVNQGNPATIANAWPALSYVPDSTGAFNVNPDAWPHAYTYTGTLLHTDAITDGSSNWVRTYTYSGNTLTGLTGWVKQ